MSDTTVTSSLSQYLKNRLDAHVAGILEAQRQVKQGLGVSHKDAMARIRSYIQKTSKTGDGF